MQRIGPTPNQSGAPFFASLFNGGSSSNSNPNNDHTTLLSKSRSRSGTSGAAAGGQGPPFLSPGAGASTSRTDLATDPTLSPSPPIILGKERTRQPALASFNGRKASFASTSQDTKSNKSNGLGRRRSPAAANGAGAAGGKKKARPPLQIVTHKAPPLPGPAIATSKQVNTSASLPSPTTALGDSFSRMLSRSGTTPVHGQMAPPSSALGQPSEAGILHRHIHKVVNKRIQTLDYLRKVHEGKIHWFNTLLFDKNDFSRMAYCESRKAARRATNYMLLGISIPGIIDFNSGSPYEYLRGLSMLFSEFDTFQSLHSEGSTSSSLSRAARLPQMFRRNGPASRARRTSGAADIGYPLEPFESVGSGPIGSSSASIGTGPGAGPGTPGTGGIGSSFFGANASANASVISFGVTDQSPDLLPGEEYSHLLTPSLPFDPDFFETFATLCDVLIDAYTRMLNLLPTPRGCTSAVGELFSKVDGRVRKIILQGMVKEFEESSRGGVKTEVANIGKVVLGCLI